MGVEFRLRSFLSCTDQDRKFECCCGFRAGWSSVIGIIPVVGDFIDLFFALYLIKICLRVEGLPKSTVIDPSFQKLTIQVSRMYANVAFDFGIGLVPILGDVADAIFKANSRNYSLLYDYLLKKGQEHPVEPPPPSKQTFLRRWFGSGPQAGTPANEPAAVRSADVPVPNTSTDVVQPSAVKVGPDRNNKSMQRDLEAQQEYHYSRQT